MILCATVPVTGSLLSEKPEITLEGDFGSNHMSILTCGDDPATADYRLLDLDWNEEGRWAAVWNSSWPLEARCVMLIYGRVYDWSSYRYYLSGLRTQRLLEAYGAKPVFFGPPVKMLRGDADPDKVVVVISLPSSEAGHEFWRSDAYSEVRKRRVGAADLNVGIWRTSR